VMEHQESIYRVEGHDTQDPHDRPVCSKIEFIKIMSNPRNMTWEDLANLLRVIHHTSSLGEIRYGTISSLPTLKPYCFLQILPWLLKIMRV
jgi:hypothetical protein